MIVAVPKEIAPGETRVALIPSLVSLLMQAKHRVLLEKNAGENALFGDQEYEEAGAEIVEDVISLYQEADVVLKVQPPRLHPETKSHEAKLMREGIIYIGFLAPLDNPEVVNIFAERRITSFSMEYIPRITRAQSMDALSSMSTIAGYKAVVMAAEKLAKMFPLLMTAAGTVMPATVLVLGAGVAGLQAIATAKRLGAKVEAFDPRPTVKEQVKSLGAGFIEMELPSDAETAGGYAKEQSEEFLKNERKVISTYLPKVDVIICTAQVFGKRAPTLITQEMVKLLKPGSIIIDLAAEQGGNCELTEAGKMVLFQGVSISGTNNLPATVPVHASQMYSRNIINFFLHIFGDSRVSPDFDDVITKDSCITRAGQVVNQTVKNLLEQGVIK